MRKKVNKNKFFFFKLFAIIFMCFIVKVSLFSEFEETFTLKKAVALGIAKDPDLKIINEKIE